MGKRRVDGAGATALWLILVCNFSLVCVLLCALFFLCADIHSVHVLVSHWLLLNDQPSFLPSSNASQVSHLSHNQWLLFGFV